MRSSILTLALCAMGLFGSVTHVAGQDMTNEAPDATEEARMHFDVGRRFYDMGHFDEAAREFEAAYAISDLVTLQYNLYLAYRDGGDNAGAASALALYVESLEDGPRRAQLAARLRILEERVQNAAQRRTDDAADAVSDSGQNAAQEPSGPGAERSTAEEPTDEATSEPTLAPWVVVGAGGALVVGAVITGVMANGEQSTLDDLCPTRDTCSGDFEGVRSRGKTLALTTDILWISGAAAIGTGLLWVMLSKGHGDSETQANLSCDGSGCLATLRGGF